MRGEPSTVLRCVGISIRILLGRAAHSGAAGRRQGGAAARRPPRPGCKYQRPKSGRYVLQETDGQVHWPFGETVKPQLFPLPFGVAVMTYSLGYVALTL
jgi:hypothetical protein